MAKEKKVKEEVVKRTVFYRYYKISMKLIREMLGTCSEASIMYEHNLKKSQKAIKKANKMVEKREKAKKYTKETTKYAGPELTDEKVISDLTGIIRGYQALIGRKEDIPTELEELLTYAKELEAEHDELLKKGSSQKATIFMKDKTTGLPIISSHMILGNFKENLKITTNNTVDSKDSKAAKSKVSVGEMMALDAKCIEEYLKPVDEEGNWVDIVRKAPDKEGVRAPDLLERQINFMRMSEKETAIAISERLPEGAIFHYHLRVRADSPFNDALVELLEYGKNNGLGAWRGSGNKGAFVYKVEEIPENPYPRNDGWN